MKQLPELQEVDFGSREGTSYRPSSSAALPQTPHGPDRRSRESDGSMAARADHFIDKYLVSAVKDTCCRHERNLAIAVVSHGIFLTVLSTRLLARFRKTNVSSAADFSGKKPRWSNTGFVLLDLVPGVPVEGLHGPRLVVEGINIKTHLLGLEKAGGGVGSTMADGKTRQIEEWPKKSQAINSMF